MFSPATHDAVAKFFAAHTCAQLERIASEHDIPMHALGD
jgi:hypothetical protein